MQDMKYKDSEESQNLDSEKLVDSSESPDSISESIEENAEIESLKIKIKELEDKYLRTHADFENVKKRLEREKSQALEYANEKILRDILPIADTLESALKVAQEFSQSSEHGEKIAQGLQLTLDKLHKTFSSHGVEIIHAQGEPDPNLHHAISQVSHPHKEDGHIAEVLQTGYTYKDRTLRPALVSVTKNG